MRPVEIKLDGVYKLKDGREVAVCAVTNGIVTFYETVDPEGEFPHFDMALDEFVATVV